MGLRRSDNHRILFVANVAKEHILKFHIPSILKFKSEGWIVDVACSGEEEIPYCDNHYRMAWKRSPYSIKTLLGIRTLRKIINTNKYDVIYCHTPVGGFVGRVASISARKSGAKVVYFAHGLHFYRGAPFINWIVFYPIEKLLTRFTDTIITINREDYDNSKKLLGCPDVHLINGIGIDIKKFCNIDRKACRSEIRKELSIPSDAWVLIYLAELLPNKNQGMLLDVLKRVMKYNPNTYLILAGIDHYNGRYIKYAKKLGVLEHVRFLGWRDDKEALYAAADICTATSIREGFGINIVEAIASGLPVVATDNRGHRMTVENGVNGYLVGINDSAKMAECIINTIGKMDVSSYNLEKYDINNVLDDIYGIISTVIGIHNTH